MAKKITLLGSTGSIGTQSLDVIRAQGYEVFGLSAHSQTDKLLQQIEEFHPKYVCMTSEAGAEKLSAALAGRADAPKLLTGPEGLKTLAGNDANMMALGETLFGAAKGATDVVFVTVGTGIGCGALIDGRLYRGYRNRGMEMGHITVKCDGEGCACGGVGCLEHYASTSALVRRFCELNGSARDAEVDGKDVVFFYKEGNPAAVQAMEEHWNYLAHGIASMINLFAPQRVVVGGGISEAGDFYLEKLREGVRRQMMSVCGEETELVAARLGNRAGCMGAAGLVLDKMG